MKQREQHLKHDQTLKIQKYNQHWATERQSPKKTVFHSRPRSAKITSKQEEL